MKMNEKDIEKIKDMDKINAIDASDISPTEFMKGMAYNLHAMFEIVRSIERKKPMTHNDRELYQSVEEICDMQCNTIPLKVTVDAMQHLLILELKLLLEKWIILEKEEWNNAKVN